MALDPRIQLLMWLTRQSGNGFRPEVSVEAFRTSYATATRNLGPKVASGVTVQQLSIPMDDGVSIGARLYRPDPEVGGPLPVLLYFHGGGWVVGDVDSYDGLTRFFAQQGQIAVLSVDYRLGPEHPFPRGHEDAFSARRGRGGRPGRGPDRRRGRQRRWGPGGGPLFLRGIAGLAAARLCLPYLPLGRRHGSLPVAPTIHRQLSADARRREVVRQIRDDRAERQSGSTLRSARRSQPRATSSGPHHLGVLRSAV